MGLAASLMGNEGCENDQPNPQLPKERQLRRRIQLGGIDAPRIQLPNNQQYGGREFDFGFVANAQMAQVIRDTQTFSTATIDPDDMFNPEGLEGNSIQEFYNCSFDEDREQANSLGMQQKLGAWTEQAACMITMPAGVLRGSVLDFAFVNSQGISLTLGGVPFMPSGSFSYEKYQLSVDLKMSSPLQRGGHADYATVRDTIIKNRSTEMGLTFDLGPISLGPKFYFTSTSNTLREAVNNVFSDAAQEIYRQWSELEPWYGMVLKDCDSKIYLNAGRGSDAGLVKGDVVAIVNVLYSFEGPVCQSYLNSELADLNNPVAYARITNVGRNMAEAQIIKDDPNFPMANCRPDSNGKMVCSGRPRIKPGARAYAHTLVKPVAPPPQQAAPVEQSQPKREPARYGRQ